LACPADRPSPGSFIGFENHLLLYLPHEKGIDVIRVFHTSRDIDGFAEEEG